MVDRKKLLTYKIFEGLDLEELDAVLACGEDLTYRDNDVILEESFAGEGPDDLFFIANGMVKVQLVPRGKDNRTAKRLATLKKGGVFGEMGLLKGKRRSAQVVAYGDELHVIKFRAQKLYDLFERYNHIGYVIMHNLASILSDRLIDLNFMWRDDI